MLVQHFKKLAWPFANPLAWPLLNSLRLKITLPYVLLAIGVAVAGAFVISQLVVDSIQDRFLSQLLGAGRLAADQVVEVENKNLATLRIIAHTDGVAQALRAKNAAAVRERVYPLAANNQISVLELLDREGRAVLSLRHQRGESAASFEMAQGTDFYAHLSLVQQVLEGKQDAAGDKFADLVLDAPWGATFYIAGPILDGTELAGVVLVGSYLDELTADLRSGSGAHHITIYGSDGQTLATTFPPDTVLAIAPQQYADILNQPTKAFVGRITANDQHYSQVFLPFQARHGLDLAVLGVALSEGYAVRASPVSQAGLTLMIGLALLSVVGVGTVVAQHITQPILQIAQASRQVAHGDLNQHVQVYTSDEVGELAKAFNDMVVQLRLAEAVKDIFGRAVSPEVSKALIEAVSSGKTSLGGASCCVSILFCDIKDFTTYAEQHTANQTVAMLNEFVGAIYPAIVQHGGVINKFGGDSTLALFGAPIPQSDHARQAVLAALAMRKAVMNLNTRRAARGEGPIGFGIGINTGEVIVGTVGAAERLEYTTIGDPVNVASRIQGFTRQFAPHDIIISQATLDELGPEHEFDTQDLGQVAVKGKTSQVHIYAVLRSKADA